MSATQEFELCARRTCSAILAAGTLPRSEWEDGLFRAFSELVHRAAALSVSHLLEPLEHATSRGEWIDVARAVTAPFAPDVFFVAAVDPADTRDVRAELRDFGSVLASIHGALAEGLARWDAGHHVEAERVWCQSYWHHWGSYAIGFLGHLHRRRKRTLLGAG
jgi:hypothetical protein